MVDEAGASRYSDAAELAQYFTRGEGRKLTRRVFSGAPPRILLSRFRGGFAAVLRPAGASPEAFALRRADGATQAKGRVLEALPAVMDRRLPGCSAMADRAELLEAAPQFFDEVRRVDLVAYRPGRRAVFQITGRSQDGVTGSSYGKCVRPRSFVDASARTMSLPRRQGTVRLLLPAAYLHGLSAWVTVEAAGDQLHGLLLAGKTLPLEMLACAVRDLASAPSRDLPEHTLEDERQRTLSMLQRGMEMDRRLVDVAAALAALPVPEYEERGFVHGDLHDKQVFLDGTGVSLIDFDDVRCGDPALDRVNFAEHVRLRGLQYRGLRSTAADYESLVDLLQLDRASYKFRFITALTRGRLAGVYAARVFHHDLSMRLADESAAMARASREEA